MVVIVKTKNNTHTLKAINVAKHALRVEPPRTLKQKKYITKKMKYLNNLTKGVQQLKKQGYQVKQLAFKF